MSARKQALHLLEAIEVNPRSAWVSQDQINDFHGILDTVNLSRFRVPLECLRAAPRTTFFDETLQAIPDGRPNTYRCEREIFLSKLNAATTYLRSEYEAN